MERPTLEEISQALKPDIRTLEREGYSLETIHQCVSAYLDRQEEYQIALKAVSELFQTDVNIAHHVHSIRYRLKNPIHLAKKLATKVLTKQRQITPSNLFLFPEGITDLGGLRILHLYKSEWLDIHNYMLSDLPKAIFDKPIEATAYHRRDEDGIAYHLSRPLSFHRVEPHGKNYSSLHYVVRYSGGALSDVYLEIQVRTLFEEGWGEIDHRWRYPEDDANKIIESQLQILNKSASMANDIASALGQFKDLPTFIPWRLEQRLERSADHVICATPSLKWACENSESIIKHLEASKVTYTYWTMIWNAETKANEDEFTRKLATVGLLSRITFKHVPPAYKNSALFSDLLLLQNVADPWTGLTQHLAVMATPAKQRTRPEDQLDILISHQGTVAQIAEFFRSLDKDYWMPQ